MKILLTGHCGFIGSALYKHLSIQHDVIGIDRIEGNDLSDCDLHFDVDLVIHLAGKSGVRKSLIDSGSYWYNNVECSRRLFDCYKDTRIIYASSSSAYEPSKNPYAASKLILEDLAKSHTNNLGLRLHTVYSDNPRKGMLFDKLINNTLDYVTPHYRDFIHIDDVIAAFDLLIYTNLRGVIDVGTGHSVSIQNLRPDLPSYLNNVHERVETCADMHDLKQLGFTPKYSVNDFLTSRSI